MYYHKKFVYIYNKYISLYALIYKWEVFVSYVQILQIYFHA